MKEKIFLQLILCFFLNSAFSTDLTRQSPIEKTISLNGKTGGAHYYTPKELVFSTGKLYKLIIKNTSDSKHYFTSNSFSKAIFTRKIEISYEKKKIAEIKGVINEVEVWPNHQIEWWFVPIKTGYFRDLQCKVKDPKKNMLHSNMGMTGTIIIK